MMLYRIDPSDGCTMTTLCLMSGDPYRAEAHTEGAVVLEAMSSATFHRQLDIDANFRTQVFTSVGERMGAMMARIDELTSVSVGSRLAACLLSRTNDDGIVQTTQDALAADCGTSREVVSRKLAAWDRDHLVSRFRGGTRLLDRMRLRQIAEERD